jgi:hypothetical protein
MWSRVRWRDPWPISVIGWSTCEKPCDWSRRQRCQASGAESRCLLYLNRRYTGSSIVKVEVWQRCKSISLCLSCAKRFAHPPSLLSVRIEPNDVVRWVTFLLWIRKVSASSFSPEVGCPEGSCDCPQLLQGIVHDSFKIRPLLLPSASFSINYSLIILSLNVMCCQLLISSWN